MFFGRNKPNKTFAEFLQSFDFLCDGITNFVLNYFFDSSIVTLNKDAENIDDVFETIDLNILSQNINKIIINGDNLKHVIQKTIGLYQSVLKENLYGIEETVFDTNKEIFKKLLDVSVGIELTTYKIRLNCFIFFNKHNNNVDKFITDTTKEDFVSLYTAFNEFTKLLTIFTYNLHKTLGGNNGKEKL